LCEFLIHEFLGIAFFLIEAFAELREAAVRWGFSADQVGLVTGNRKENAEAPILVVVAEILLNRLLSPEEESFEQVSAVVMDEFHSFNDPERGIVWELSLGLLPKHVRLLLISATVGNATDFTVWLSRMHGRTLRLLQSTERRVPLDFRWVADEFLPDQLQEMSRGDEQQRYTPALVFCFNRSECWSVAEQLRGRDLLADGQQRQLISEIARHDWSIGAGGKLRQLLLRGIGLHHAGLLPRYRRVVEQLFQQKLLSVCICTETLAAGINLPARSVVMTSLLKGPPGGMKLIDASSAHQMFGRAGRPQFDSRGYVFAVAHEDDVRLFRWQQKYDEIPEDTRDPHLIRAKKNLKKKMPKRREGVQYWSERQFHVLRDAPPVRLASRGSFPWRLLAFLIRRSGTVQTLFDAINRRLLEPAEKESACRQLVAMLRTLADAGFVTLEPPPPCPATSEARVLGESGPSVFRSVLAEHSVRELLAVIDSRGAAVAQSRWLSTHLPAVGAEEGASVEAEEVDGADGAVAVGESEEDFGVGLEEGGEERAGVERAEGVVVGGGAAVGEGGEPLAAEKSGAEAAGNVESGGSVELGASASAGSESGSGSGLLGRLISEARTGGTGASSGGLKGAKSVGKSSLSGGKKANAVVVTEESAYQPRLAIATEPLKLINSFRSINPLYGVYLAEHMHRASYEERLQLLESVLDMPSSVAVMVRVPLPEAMPPGPLAVDYLNPRLLSLGLVTPQDLTGYFDEVERRKVYPLPLGDRMRMLFQHDYPGVGLIPQRSIWCVGDLLRFGGNFDRYVRARELTKQEGVVFRHCLRLILLCGEFADLEPPQLDAVEWRRDLAELAAILTESCRAVDPASTDETLTALRSHAAGQDLKF
ncbi:MAG: DEAD/DEAH box helicase, partial [Planctomycetaceae bacterium]